MSLTLLFDLDDTLLDTNMEVFIPAYFQALSTQFADRVPSTAMLSALMSSTKLIYKSRNPMRTLRDVFDENFYRQLGVSRNELAGLVEQFYDHVFPALRAHTRRMPDAVPLIKWALSSGYRVALATDPLFPCRATLHRVRWAGLEPEYFDIISTVENFHFSKTYPAYYAEVLGRMGWPEGPVLMVGNDVERDMAPFAAKSIEEIQSVISKLYLTVFGKYIIQLADLRPWLESIDLSTLEPSYKSREAILGIMASTPAVLRSLSSSLTDEQWKHEPTREDWALNEIVCHLRDTEREVHQAQLKLMLERTDAFIPRPDSGVWASVRKYLNVNGSTALIEFVSARMETLDMLTDLDDETWSRKARHAIFGPTNFLEVLGFMAEHDRLHIQQAWKTLQSV